MPSVDPGREHIDREAARLILVNGHTFRYFEGIKTEGFWALISANWRPIHRDKVVKLLPSIYDEYRQSVRQILDRASVLNIIFDGSDDISHNRIINVSVEIPGSVAFYWKTINTGAEDHTAVNTVRLIRPVLEEIFGTDFARLNAVCTDTNNTMRAVHREMELQPEFKHCFFSLCSSHGFQLLVNDIGRIPRWKQVFEQTKRIVGYFRSSRLQLARVRECQMHCYKKQQAFVAASFTRWGTHSASVTSVFRNREALERYSRQVDFSGDTKMQEVVLLINNSTFWADLRLLKDLLEPVIDAQELSEADRSNVGYVIHGWERIRVAWAQMFKSAGFSAADQQDLLAAVTRRTEKQTDGLHWAAYALNPATTVVRGQIPPNKLLLAEEFLQKYTPADQWPEVKSDFYNFRQREGEIYHIVGGIYDLKDKPKDVWTRLNAYGAAVAPIACRIYGSLANSVPSERSFSATNFIHSKHRNRMSPEVADQCAFIYMNSRVLARLDDPKRPYTKVKEAERWSTVVDQVMIDMEDEILAALAPDDTQFLSALGQNSCPDDDHEDQDGLD